MAEELGNRIMRGPLSNLLGLEVGLVHQYSGGNTKISEDTEKKIKAIDGALSSAKESINSGIIAIGRMMWMLSNLDNGEIEDERRILNDMGGLIEELGQLLYELDWHQSYSGVVIADALEQRLKQGGSR